MRVFLDVGAYDGTVIRQVLASPWVFDRYYCFEPQRGLYEALCESVTDPRVMAFPFGLGNTTGIVPFYRGHRLASASIYREKRFRGAVRESQVALVSASEWFRQHLAAPDTVVMRMNCEGAECDILENLCASGEIRKVQGLAVAWDIRKVAGQEARGEAIRATVTACVPKLFTLQEHRAKQMGAAYLHRWMTTIA